MPVASKENHILRIIIPPATTSPTNKSVEERGNKRREEGTEQQNFPLPIGGDGFPHYGFYESLMRRGYVADDSDH